MKRSYAGTWAALAVFGVATALGLAWVTSVLLEFEKERRESRAAERLQADLRLAAWRIDAMLAPLLAEEAARPASHFNPFSPLQRSLDPSGGSNPAGRVIVPSPVLNGPGRWTALNFQIDSGGTVSSPQVPRGANAKWAGELGVAPETIRRHEERLAEFSSAADKAEVGRMLDTALSSSGGAGGTGQPPGGQRLIVQAEPGRNPGQGIDDYNARNRAYDRMAVQQNMSNTRIWNEVDTVSRPVPMWLSGSAGEPLLVLARRVDTAGGRLVQGAVLDWPAIRKDAEAEIRDLFPGASLCPRPPGRPADPNRALAVLPLEIDPGPVPPPGDEPLLTPLRVGIAALWTAFAAGFSALLLGISGLLALNRRRLDFVSAVTHELRTPLTTFRMYAEMLEDGMVPQEKIAEYYGTLREESLRLTHLVQNVLDYSRLESDKSRSRIETAPLEAHMAGILPLLRDRCGRAGMPFSYDDGGCAGLHASLDSSAVGQILVNLADNACKYGKGEVRLSVKLDGRSAEFAVSDGGGPIAPADRKRMFEPFARGSGTEGKAPGVGLGLALCRRWARAMGGDLEYRPGPPHAFVLRLPV